MTYIHPFPARLGPEIARDHLMGLSEGGPVLDPMCGSGVVLREATQLGIESVGYDLDPMAVLMSRVWTTRLDPDTIVARAEKVARTARAIPDSRVVMPWECPETDRFARFWYATPQLLTLAKTAAVLADCHGAVGDALRVALGRTVITKTRGASLGRDISHSRPHRVATSNDYDVHAGFVTAARTVAERLKPENIRAPVTVKRLDARTMTDTATYTMAITSPPYLNAIDYIRGHRLALIWFGWPIPQLRQIRASLVGAERKAPPGVNIDPFVTGPENMTDAQKGWIHRYIRDIRTVMTRTAASLTPGARAVLIVGDSTVRSARVSNTLIVADAAERAGLASGRMTVREISTNRRYLPPPGGPNAMGKRVRHETITVFHKHAPDGPTG